MNFLKIISFVLLAVIMATGCSNDVDEPPILLDANVAINQNTNKENSSQISIKRGEGLTMLTEGFSGNYNAQTENGYYELLWEENINILYTDFATNEKQYLCDDENCNHADENCNSYFPVDLGLILLMPTEDYVYYWYYDNGSNQSNTLNLCHMNFDGSEKTLVKTFDDGDGLYGGVATDGENFYAIFENFDNSTGVSTFKLVSINIATGEVKTIKDFASETTSIFPLGVMGREFVFMNFGKPENYTLVDLANGKDKADAAKETIAVSSVNVDTAKETFLFDYNALQTKPMIENGDIYYFNTENSSVDKFDFQNKTSSELAKVPQERANTYFIYAKEGWVIYDYNTGENPEQNLRVAVNTQTGEETQLELTYESEAGKTTHLLIMAEYGDYYWVVSGYDVATQTIKDAENNKITIMDRYISECSLILKSDYFTNNANFIVTKDFRVAK